VDNLLFYDIPSFTSQFINSGVREGSFLGIDYGKRKIGLATTDQRRVIAFPECVLFNEDGFNQNEIIDKIINIIISKNVCAIVCGLPLTLDGSFHDLFFEIKNFIQILQKHLYIHNNLNIPIIMLDERMTTVGTYLNLKASIYNENNYNPKSHFYRHKKEESKKIHKQKKNQEKMYKKLAYKGQEDALSAKILLDVILDYINKNE
jgi:putative Holliday junction resolvase